MTVVLGSIGWGLIAVGAITHTWHHQRLRELLSRHLDSDRPAAAALVAIEVAITCGIAIGVVAGASWLPIAALAGAVLAAGFVGWIARLLLTGSDLPCACSFSAAPTSVWSLVRAAAVLLVAVLAVADPSTLAVADRVSALLVGLAAAASIYVFPEALGWPEFSRAQLARLDSHRPINRSTTEVPSA